MSQLIAIAGASFLVTFLAIIALRPLAYAIDLIDRPGGHKTHHGDIPLMGGLAMFFGIVFGLAISGAAAYPLTALLIMASINAFNMLDGMDGLAGGVSLSAFLFFAGVAAIGGSALPLSHASVMIGAVVAFLIFNAPLKFNESIRCFMGDAGSTILGFFVALLCIELSQGSRPAVPPATALWFVAWPLFELLWSTVRRIAARRSPFKADNQHFHHVLTAAGFGVRSIFGIAIGLSLLFAGMGLLLKRLGAPEALSFALLIVSGVGTVYFVHHAGPLLRFVPPAYRRKVPPLETDAAMGDSGTH
jgi:UDP-GlcNAc:undecaprenyl-phosphate GlcNAc-1-phosphate transferase